MNLLNWDGNGSPEGMFPAREALKDEEEVR